MNRTRLTILAGCLSAALPVAMAADATDLNVTRVALFSSGVGYFEREAKVADNTTAELKFRTDQINDIIKSMVVQDFGGGKIGVISYASQDPIEKTLRSFGVDLRGKPTLAQLLDQLRGEPVEIEGPRKIAGVIVGVEKAPIIRPDGQTLQQIERLTVQTADAGLQQIELTQIQGLKLRSRKVEDELNKALATLATAHDADKKTVTLSFEGKGERAVRAAYLLEAPIWKTSYRMVLTGDKKPFIQGWATVENATEEDWNDVRLSLISGRPISFRMDLYTPLYVPRPLEQLELYASLRPPEYEGGVPLAAELAPPPMAQATAAPAKAEERAKRAGRPGAPGSILAQRAQAGDDVGELAQLGVQLTLADAGVASVATAKEAGELFAYHIDTPVSLARQHSAMLPIVNEAVEAEKVSIYNRGTHEKYPLNGLELKNTTKLHLMQGPITIFDDNVYGGDAKLPDLKPGEKRLVAYALDLSTEVIVKPKSTQDELVSLKIAKGVLIHRHKLVDERSYEFKNKAGKDRTIILEQAYSPDWTLVEPKPAYETTQNLLRFRVQAAADKVTPQVVRLERVMDQMLALTDTGLDQIQIYLRTKVITAKIKEALEKVVALRVELDEIAQQRQRAEKEHKEATAEQARIRENLRTLDRSSDAYKEQMKKFSESEKQITDLRDQMSKLRTEEEQKRKALQDYLLSLEVE
jgi:hypothetical protein